MSNTADDRYDRERRERIEREQTQNDAAALRFAAVAAALGATWTRDPERPEMAYCQPTRPGAGHIIMPDGVRIWARQGGSYGGHGGQDRYGAAMPPELSEHASYDDRDALRRSVNVGNTKPAATVAKDLTRRLLVGLSEAWRRAEANAAAYANTATRTAQLSAELAALIPGARDEGGEHRPNGSNANGTPTCHHVHSYETPSVDAKVRAASRPDDHDRVDMEIKDMTHAQAVAIARLLFSTQEATKCPTHTA